MGRIIHGWEWLASAKPVARVSARARPIAIALKRASKKSRLRPAQYDSQYDSQYSTQIAQKRAISEFSTSGVPPVLWVVVSRKPAKLTGTRHELCTWGEPTRPGVGGLSRKRYTQYVEHN